MTRYGRWAHVIAAWLFAAGVLVQGFLAGTALPQLGGSGDFGAHIEFGYTVMFLLAAAVLVTALLVRCPRPQVGLSVLLLGCTSPSPRSCRPARARRSSPPFTRSTRWSCSSCRSTSDGVATAW